MIFINKKKVHTLKNKTILFSIVIYFFISIIISRQVIADEINVKFVISGCS